MLAVVFDIDGTLTRSTGVDDECLVEALRRVLGIRVTDTDWGRYVHSTDDGLTVECCERGLGRRPSAAEVQRVRAEFLGLLGARIGAEPGLCRPVEGAVEVLEELRGRAGVRVGVASGAWPGSAAIKLGAAGIDLGDERAGGVPRTFSFVGPDGEPARREAIIAATLGKLGVEPGRGGGRAVYVGDGVWDARAARALGIGFVGVRRDGDRARLEREGATRIIERYGGAEGLLGIVGDARPG